MGKAGRKNIAGVVALIAEFLKSSLGPRGRTKLLLNPYGDSFATNDGLTILKYLEVSHPIGKLLLELARTMDYGVGDGTKSVIILAAELTAKGEELIDRGIHPS